MNLFKKSHAREHKTPRVKPQVNLNEVLNFINRATRQEMDSIQIAIDRRPSWITGRKGVCNG